MAVEPEQAQRYFTAIDVLVGKLLAEARVDPTKPEVRLVLQDLRMVLEMALKLDRSLN